MWDLSPPKMNDNCEICGTSLTNDNIHVIVLIDDKTGEVLNDMRVCDICSKLYEFAIGVVELG